MKQASARTFWRLITIVGIAISLPSGAEAVQAPPAAAPATTRAEEIQRQRAEKQARLQAELPGRAEEAFVRAQDVAEMLTGSRSGLRLKASSTAPGWDGLIIGSGFSLGPEYYRPDLLNGELSVRASAVGTLKKNYLFDFQLTLPRLASDTVVFDVLGRYKAERSINYYGPGPDSPRSARTNYARETSEAGLRLAWQAVRHLELGIRGSALAFNVGPGIAPGVSSTERVFDESTTPGIHQQTNFIRSGAYIEFDSRNKPYMPARGTQAGVRMDRYNDRKHSKYSFYILKAQLQQSLPFFNEKRVLALRAETAISYVNSRRVVPFYLQQTLGGPDDLRGFRLFRFTDNNKLAMNAEYRWEVAPPLDMAIFVDGGKVFHRTGDLNFSNFEAAGGIGARIKTRSAVAVRLDYAYSREGFQLWFRFSDIF